LEPSITDWITALGTFATTTTVVILIWTVSTQKKQLLVSNFEVITNYTGDLLTRQNRGILYKIYDSPIMKKLLQQYPNIEDDKELTKLSESLKQISAMYERVGFLVSEDRNLEIKYLEYHGFTTALMWKIFEPFDNVINEKDKSKGYTFFRRLGEKSYHRWKTSVDDYLREKSIRNKERANLDFLLKNDAVKNDNQQGSKPSLHQVK